MSTITTTALVCHEINKPLVLEDVVLGGLRPNEAVVEIEATGVCHTDLSCIDGTLPAALPNIFGHEGAGTVVEVGDAIKHIQKGDKVLLSFNYCGTCAQCKAGHMAYCTSFMPLNFSGQRLDGTHTIQSSQGENVFANFFGQSSFMRHAIVSETSMVKVPPETPLNLFAALGCGLQTGAGCVINTLQAKPGSTLAVFGVGPVGMAGIMAGKIVGCSTIIAIDLRADRRAIAKEIGATHIIDGADPDVIEQIRKICPPNGVQFAMDGTGVPKVVETMIESLGTRGRAATVGAPKPGSKAAVDVFNHLILGREYVGCTEGDADPKTFIPFLIEEHAKGNFPIEKLISFYDIKDFQKAFQDMKETKVIKPVLIWK